MTVAPTSFLARPLHQLRDKLLACPSWVTWCGGSTAANKNAYLIACPDRAPLPQSLIGYDPDGDLLRAGIADGPSINALGLRLYFCAQALSGGTDGDVLTDFLNHVGAVISELQALPSDGGTSLVIDDIRIRVQPTRILASERDKNGDQVEMLFTLTTRSYSP